MPSVALINSYRMGEAQRLVRAGLYPAQHLWGIHYLDPRWQTSTTDLSMNYLAEKHAWLSPILRTVEKVVGDPIQCLWAVTGKNRGSIVYAANPKTGTFVAMLKKFNLVRVPYVVLVHSWPVSRWARTWLAPATHLMVFSGHIKDRMVQDGFDSSKISVVHWGPDLEWAPYGQVALRDLDFVAAGKTNRDYAGLIRAAEVGALKGEILDGVGQHTFRDGVMTSVPGRPTYVDTVSLMSRAHEIVIPLLDSQMLSGLTELCDAIALRIPIVMTQNSWSPIDIEAEGIGVWIADSAEPTLSATLGRPTSKHSSFESVRERFSARRFSGDLEAVLTQIAGKR